MVRRLYGALSEGFPPEFEQRLTDEALGDFLDPGTEWVPVAHSLLAFERAMGASTACDASGASFVSTWET